MDKLKGMAGGMGGAGGDQKATGGTGNEDYVDKGLDATEKKFGLPENRSANEKITDTARTQIEHKTGKKIPEKVSN